MRLQVLALTLFATITASTPWLFSSCGSEAGNPDDDEDEPTKYQDPDGTMAYSLTEVFDNGAKVMTTALSADQADLGGGGAGLLEGMTVGSTPYCTSYGKPISPNAEANTEVKDGIKFMGPGYPDYAAGFFYCLMTQDTNSSESVPGVFIRAKIFPCIAGRIRFDGVTRTVTMAVDDPALTVCAGDMRVAGLKENGIKAFSTTYTATKIDVGGWEGEVTFENKFDDQLGATDRIRVTRNDQRESMAVLTTDPSGIAEAVVYHNDAAAGRVFYERWAPKIEFDDGSESNVHARLYLEGVLAEGAFASLTKYQGMHAVIQSPDTNSEGRFLTISGGSATGFRTQHLNCFKAGDACGDHKVLADWQAAHKPDNCYGGTACSGEIKIDAASFPFILDEGVAAGVLEPKAWFEQLVVPDASFVFGTGRVQQ
jgi:hypothetical protein